jgi:hypothetical protein
MAYKIISETTDNAWVQSSNIGSVEKRIGIYLLVEKTRYMKKYSVDGKRIFLQNGLKTGAGIAQSV